uniref:DUF559 domain-containing protein n=1 Tax=viral metagenome TaxID=1070528 RepID=A0A6M3LI62_9ZZZZ
MYTHQEKVVFSRKLRKNSTPAEKRLWDRIRRKQLGAKFHRQAVKYGYILDFYCPRYHFAIELDGNIHDPKKDMIRDRNLMAFGIKTIRFNNADVLYDIGLVISEIIKHMEE